MLELNIITSLTQKLKSQLFTEWTNTFSLNYLVKFSTKILLYIKQKILLTCRLSYVGGIIDKMHVNVQRVSERCYHGNCMGVRKLYKPVKISTQAERSRKTERFHRKKKRTVTPVCVHYSDLRLFFYSTHTYIKGKEKTLVIFFIH